MVERNRAAPRGYHHGDLRRALLAQARIVIERDGIDGLKMSGLSAELGVSVAAPFRHFPNREALLVALANEGADKLVIAMEHAAAQQTEALEAHRARGVAYVRFAVAEPSYFRLMCRREIVESSAQLRQLSASQREMMDPVLGRVQSGEVSIMLAQRSAGLLAAQALTYGLARMITDGLLGDVTPEEAERLALELTAVLGEGLLERKDEDSAASV